MRRKHYSNPALWARDPYDDPWWVWALNFAPLGLAVWWVIMEMSKP